MKCMVLLAAAMLLDLKVEEGDMSQGKQCL